MSSTECWRISFLSSYLSMGQSFSLSPLAFHFQEALWRIFYALLSFFLVGCLSWVSLEKLFVYLLSPVDRYQEENISFLTSSLAGVLEAYWSVLFHSALFFSFPFWIYQIWAYIRPSLYRKESFHFSSFFGSSLVCGLFFFSLFYSFLFPLLCTYFLDAGRIETVYEFLYYPDLAKYFQILRAFYCLACFSLLSVFCLSLFFASFPSSFLSGASFSLRKLAWVGSAFLTLLLSPPEASLQFVCFLCLAGWFEICFFCICVLHSFFSLRFPVLKKEGRNS
uniref:SecY-independent transporter protein n=1 Tax=Prasinococcus sp. CCMP1194 TaxID=110672 RepID=A0A650AKM4_9VIRI|nr:SecY-independent transporter protein [Prasinococcus sp. CCMP1194]